MLGWDDQELANVIWDEEGESEDHIVPYPDEPYEKPSGLYGEHSNATKLELEHTDEKTQVDSGAQGFDNQPEDKDASSFVDYGWAHVGSFGDLDRILSNNDLVYGDASISNNSDALWSSPKDVIGCPEKSELLRGDSHGKTITWSMVEAKMRICGRKSMYRYVSKAKIRKPKKVKLHNPKHLVVPGFCLRIKARNECSPYKQFINPDYKLRENQPALPQFHSGEEYQQVPSGSSSDKTPLMATSTMTPQEKVEKLRRHQQMRALLAIRKQQQQFRHQNDYSNLGKYLHETQIDGSLSTLMSEQSDLDKTTLEDAILHQLENVISKLDIEIRLCIRDSLFRLAHSALRRQYAGDDKISSNRRRSRDEASVIVEERLSSTKSSARSADGETKTNPIDRAVAHFLFHTPPGEFLHSPWSARQTTTSAKGFPNERYEDDQFSCLVEQENKETDGGSRVEIEASSRGTPLL